MRQNREKIFNLVVGAEGNYCNDVGDPGGPTKYGITIHDTIKWFGGGQLTSANYSKWTERVKALTLEEALAIYDKKYWAPVRGDELPSGIDLLLFDFGINAGPTVGIKKLQKCLGINQDGVIGNKTLSAIWALPDFKPLNSCYYDVKIAFYRSLGTWSRFGRGWTNRADKMKREALRLFKPVADEIALLPEATKVALGYSKATVAQNENDLPVPATDEPKIPKVWS